MPGKKLPYREGDWFAVPLRTQGYATGIVTRLNGQGTILAYFFRVLFEEVPHLRHLIHLVPEDAIWIRLVGDLGLLRGEWPIVGYHPNWEPSVWVMPAFGRIAVDGSWATSVVYSESDLSTCISEASISIEEARKLPEDGLSGHKAAEVRLTKFFTTMPHQ